MGHNHDDCCFVNLRTKAVTKNMLAVRIHHLLGSPAAAVKFFQEDDKVEAKNEEDIESMDRLVLLDFVMEEGEGNNEVVCRPPSAKTLISLA